VHLRLSRLLPIALGLVLVACGGVHRQPQPSAPLDHLVIGRSQRLTMRMPNGQEQTLVRTPAGSFPTSPAWSPDGSRIAYVESTPFTGDTTADWGGDIYVLPATGGSPQLVRKHTRPGDEVFGLDWTADGGSLLLGQHVTVYENGVYKGASQDVLRLDLSTGASSVLVPNAVFPTVSRDGSRMAYIQQDPNVGQGGVFVANIDGQNAREVVPIGERFPAILYPHISPSGDEVAFSAPPGQPATPAASRSGTNGLLGFLAGLLPRAAEAHGLPMDVWRATVADSSLQQLTHLSADDPCTAWSADEKTIAFIATGGLYTVSADGGELHMVGPGEFNGNIDTLWAGAR
jgi:Tol biopolymer transport system component